MLFNVNICTENQNFDFRINYDIIVKLLVELVAGKKTIH